MRSAAAGSGLQAERRAFGCGTEGGGRHGRGPRLSAVGLEGRRRGGAYILQTLGPRGWSVGTAGQLFGGLRGGLRGSLWRRRARAGQVGLRGGRGGPARGPAVPTAPGFVHRRRQTRASGSCQPSALFFFFFLRKRQLLPKERSHICLRTVIGLSCNLIREGAVAPPRPLFPFFFLSGSVRGFLAFSPFYFCSSNSWWSGDFVSFCVHFMHFYLKYFFG